MDFKDYIFKTLRWPLCLNPGPVAAICLGLARVFNGVVKDIYWLRDQFNPATCEDEFLPMLAESRGIIRHRLETDDIKFRQRVIKAFAWQLLGGKNSGMPKLLDHFGYEVSDILNVRNEDVARWAEFKIKIAPLAWGTKEDDFNLLNWAINESKPARSKLAAIQVPCDMEGAVGISGLPLLGISITASMSHDVNLKQAQTFTAAQARIGISITATLARPEISSEPELIYSTCLVRLGNSINGVIQ